MDGAGDVVVIAPAPDSVRAAIVEDTPVPVTRSVAVTLALEGGSLLRGDTAFLHATHWRGQEHVA